ncbi:MAG TPA: type II toxin-antitoxin system VapC family toxin, partial [Steroidobacteraceae bacterium]|nr:type II toxin-antitoxin system VapC family toxin [Steroidobacteraceae bacterium]
MSLYMLDTDISSYIIRKRPESLLERFQEHAEVLCVSVVTAAELQFGAQKAARPKLTALVKEYLDRLPILDWTQSVIAHYARIRTALERAGRPMGNMDLLIAAHAVSEGSTLVSNNVRHFEQVPGL